jgi:hypothetical protein
MKTHEQIDRRSLVLAKAIALKIDSDPDRNGLAHARQVCKRWLENDANPLLVIWQEILEKTWWEVRSVLLDQSEYSVNLRQNMPFTGILTPKERWEIYKEFEKNETS